MGQLEYVCQVSSFQDYTKLNGCRVRGGGSVQKVQGQDYWLLQRPEQETGFWGWTGQVRPWPLMASKIQHQPLSDPLRVYPFPSLSLLLLFDLTFLHSESQGDKAS